MTTHATVLEIPLPDSVRLVPVQLTTAGSLPGKSVHSVLDPKTEQRAILGHASGLETPVSRLAKDLRQGKPNNVLEATRQKRRAPEPGRCV